MTEKEILKHLNKEEINTMFNIYKNIIDITVETLF